MGNPTALSSIPVKDEFASIPTVSTAPDKTPEPVPIPSTPTLSNPPDTKPEEKEKNGSIPPPSLKPEPESKSESGPHTAPTIEISSLQEPSGPTQSSPQVPPLQRSSSLTLTHAGLKNLSHSSGVHQQRVIHHKTLSSSSYRHGYGSGTLSPSLMIASIQSPSRGHIHAVSLESVERVSETE